MAGVAHLGGIDVGWRFANGRHIVVTAGAGANHLVVVYGAGGHRGPAGREFVMAALAQVTAADMTGTFTTGIHPVVAAHAVPHKAAVVYRRRDPAAGGMTGVAFFVGDDVRRVFTGGGNTIVAAGTHAQNLAVIHL